MDRHRAAHRLAETQHGLISRRQLRDDGWSRTAIDRQVERGRWERLSRRVLRVAGSPDTTSQRMAAAVLDLDGSCVALWSAAAVWGMPGFTVEPVHVLATRVPHRGSPRIGVAHSSTNLSEDHVALVDGIPVTTPVRTLVDLAPRIHPMRLAALCDRMWANRLLDGELLAATVDELVSPKRPGMAGVRALLVERGPGYRPAESNTERRLESILADAGEASLERQVDLGDADGWVGRVDFVDRRRRVVVEVQSELYHGSITDRRRDAERLGRLRAAGWVVVEVTELEVWHRPDRVVERIRAARRRTSPRAA